MLDLLPHGDTIISCLTCSLSHRLPPDPGPKLASEIGFRERHVGHLITYGVVASPAVHAQYGVRWNSDLKIAFQALQTMTVTNLHSLANSATAGWQSAVVDNESNLFLDALLMLELEFANTAPANSRAAFIYAYGGLESGVYTNPASGSEGTLTLVDVTTTPQNLKLIGTVVYSTTNEKAEAGPFSVAAGFGGVLPPFWGIGLINHSGAALEASGNTVKYRGVYATSI
jgi:hypothetical protein